MPGLLFSDGLSYYQQVRSPSPRSSRPNPEQREAIRNRVNPLAPREPLYPSVFPAVPPYPPAATCPEELLPWGAPVIPSSAFERGEARLRKQMAAAAKVAEAKAAKKAEAAEAKAAEKAAKKASPAAQSLVKGPEKKMSKLKLKLFSKDKTSLVENPPVQISPAQPHNLIESPPARYQGDESLQRYKESLGLGGGGKDLSNPNDPRVCIIDSLSMESPGRDPVTIDLSTPGSETTLKDKPFKVKEGAKFTMVAKFRVQHEILSGLQYVQVVKRKGIRVSKDSEMLGSFAPNTDKAPTYTKRFQEEDAPSGMLARGHYNANSTFVDDDKKTHLAFEWSFDIAKDW